MPSPLGPRNCGQFSAPQAQEAATKSPTICTSVCAPCSQGSDLDFIALPLLARQPAVCLLVTDNLLLLSIPLERSVQADGDVGQVAGGHRAVMREDVGDRQ